MGAIAGCGQPATPRGAAEPAVAPTLAAIPAGQLVHVGFEPEGIAVDLVSHLVSVIVRSPDGLVILDPAGSIVNRVPLPSGGRHLSMAPGGPLLIPCEKARQLVTVNVSLGRVESATAVGRQPHDAVFAARRIFVGNEFSDSVSVIENAAVIRTVPGPGQPGGLAATPGKVAVLGVHSRTIEVIDTGSLEPIGTVDAGVGPTHIVADGSRYLVADTQGNAILVYATEPSIHQAARIATPGTPYGIAIDPTHHHLFVTLTARNLLAEYDTTPLIPTLIRTVPTVRQPNTVAVDPSSGTVYVTGTADGVVEIIS